MFLVGIVNLLTHYTDPYPDSKNPAKAGFLNYFTRRARRDFLRPAVFFLITPRFAALSTA